VIGGGNSAMDAARSARRLTGGALPPQGGGGRMTIVYRRTRQEMPAGEEEIEDALAEGILLQELVSPAQVVLREGQVIALECVRNELGEAGADEAPGMDPDVKEAVAFAVLADRAVAGEPGNVPAATGASGPVVLGKFSFGM
ncbi:MAG: anhydro-N-acetylmuramic acid kinase, partial [Candidatus Eisenbacteria sp.]|nr:anhydro-N-acetylmuramic acid kinase [Candidatus Eisenbacteria bacterium]